MLTTLWCAAALYAHAAPAGALACLALAGWGALRLIHDFWLLGENANLLILDAAGVSAPRLFTGVLPWSAVQGALCGSARGALILRVFADAKALGKLQFRRLSERKHDRFDLSFGALAVRKSLDFAPKSDVELAAFACNEWVAAEAQRFLLDDDPAVEKARRFAAVTRSLISGARAFEQGRTRARRPGRPRFRGRHGLGHRYADRRINGARRATASTFPAPACVHSTHHLDHASRARDIPAQHREDVLQDQEAAAKRHPPLYVSAEIFARSAFPAPHPLAFPRAGLVKRCAARSVGSTALTSKASRPAAPTSSAITTPAMSRRLRAPTAISSSRRTSGKNTISGLRANPIFPGLFERAATAVGGSLLAARLAFEGRVVFHPPGGTHHGGKAAASGFCFFNDPVFAILELLALGAQRVAYVDFDAHHGDGVEEAYAEEPRVMTISIHEADRWPRTGALSDRRGGNARNMPVPRGLNDDEFALLVEEAVLPLLGGFAPDALVILSGADALAGDPLAKLALSNGALVSAVARVAALAPAVVVLGGAATTPGTSREDGRACGLGSPALRCRQPCLMRRA